MSFDWNQLRSFEAVAREGSLVAVSRKTGATQPTLSRHIKELEKSLGIQLFDRTANGLILTPAGTKLFVHAQKMSTSANTIALAATGQAESLAGTVRITASQSVARFILPPILAELQVQESSIEIEVIASAQTDNLLQREADIALRMYEPEQLDVITKRLGEVCTVAYASKEYLKTRGCPRSISDLQDHDFIGYDLQPQIIKAFNEAGIKVDRHFFRFRSDDEDVCWQMVLNGFGVGFALTAVGDNEPRVERLLESVATKRTAIWLTAHHELRTSSRIRYVYDYLSEKIQKTLKHWN